MTHGDASVQNELGVTMEEVDVWKVWAYLGETMRHRAFDSISWFPEVEGRGVPMNRHIDKRRYQARWREEIRKTGGFARLTTAHQLDIRYGLVQEFGIRGMRAPRPGDQEWLAMKLPWPWPPMLEQLRTLAPTVAVRGNNDKGAWAAELPVTRVVEIGEVQCRSSPIHAAGDCAARLPPRRCRSTRGICRGAWSLAPARRQAPDVSDGTSSRRILGRRRHS